jgi:hypothetical protein
VAVHSEAIVESLAKVYGADRLVAELRGKRTKVGAAEPAPAGGAAASKSERTAR